MITSKIIDNVPKLKHKMKKKWINKKGARDTWDTAKTFCIYVKRDLDGEERIGQNQYLKKLIMVIVYKNLLI